MNTRMQVTIPSHDHARAVVKAAAAGISLAEYLRRLVRRDLEEQEGAATPDVTELFGLGDSGGGDVGSHRGAYLADAIAAEKADPNLRP